MAAALGTYVHVQIAGRGEGSRLEFGLGGADLRNTLAPSKKADGKARMGGLSR
jgi:hypothetical protein